MPSIDTPALWTALVTPFHPNGAIDFDSMTGLLRKQEAAGNGVLLLGSTGEALSLNGEEKRQVLHHALSLKLGSPLLIGVEGHRLQEQLEWIAYCNTLDIAGFLLLAPIYAKPGPHGQLQWFKSLLDASAHPCMFYNHPGRTGRSIAPEVLASLASHPRAWALKEATGTLEAFQTFYRAAPMLKYYSGCDELTRELCEAGAVGLVSVAANLKPEETRDFLGLCMRGQAALCDEDWKAFATAAGHCNPCSIKAALYAEGWIASPFLRPPLAVDDAQSLPQECTSLDVFSLPSQ